MPWTSGGIILVGGDGVVFGLESCPECPCGEGGGPCTIFDYEDWTDLFNTGVDSSRATVDKGNCEVPVLDEHWVLGDDSEAFVTGGWFNSSAGSFAEYISVVCDGIFVPGGDPDGETVEEIYGLYSFKTSFTIPVGVDPDGLWMMGYAYADDIVYDILVNGVSTKNSGYGGLHFLLGRGFQAGSNEVEFIIGQDSRFSGELSFLLAVLWDCFYQNQEPRDGYDNMGIHGD